MRSCDFHNTTSTQCSRPSTVPPFIQAMVFEEWISANSTMLRVKLAAQSSRHVDGEWKTGFCLLFDHRLQPQRYEANGKELNFCFTPSFHFLPLFILHFGAVEGLRPIPTVSERGQSCINNQCTHTSKQFRDVDQMARWP